MTDITENDYIDLFNVEYSPPKDSKMLELNKRSIETRKAKSEYVTRYIQGLIHVGFSKKEILNQKCVYVIEQENRTIYETISITQDRYKEARRLLNISGKEEK